MKSKLIAQAREDFQESKDLLENVWDKKQETVHPSPAEEKAHKEALAGILDGLGQCAHMDMAYEEAVIRYGEAILNHPTCIDYLKNRA